MPRHEIFLAQRLKTHAPLPVHRGRVRKRYVALIVVLLLLGWVGWKVFAIMSARPGPMVDYTKQLIALSEKYQPEGGENGWPALVAALEHFDNIGVPDVEGWPTDPDALWSITHLDAVCKGPFDRERLKFELLYLAHIEQSGVLEELDAALAAPRFVRTKFHGMEAGLIVVDHYEGMRGRKLAASRRAAMRTAIESGSADRFLRACEELVGIAHAISFESFLISGLVAMRILESGLDEIAISLTERDLDESTCRRILDILSSRPVLSPIEITWESERIFSHDAIQRTHTDDGNGNGILQIRTLEQYAGLTSAPSGTLPGGSFQTPASNLLGLMYPTRRETTRVIDEFFDAAVAQSRMKRRDRLNQLVDMHSFVETLPERQVFAHLMLAATGSVNDMRDCTDAKVAATSLLLAIEMFQDRHHRLPESLDVLVPEFLPALPVDPVSGLPFVLRSREPSEDDLRTFRLYSIGIDGIDNGGSEIGVSARDCIDALRDAQNGQGFDYIFNRLREPVEEEQK